MQYYLTDILKTTKLIAIIRRVKKSSLTEVSEVYLFAYYKTIPTEIDRSQNVVHRT